MDFSAMLAYNLLITLLPIAVALFGILGLVLKNYPDAQREVKDKIINLFPSDNTTQTGIKQVKIINWYSIYKQFRYFFKVVDLAFNQLSRDAGLILAIGIFFALFGASRLFIAIDKCMTIIYRLPQRTFLRQNMLAFGMLFFFILIIPIILAASSAPAALLSIIPGGGGRFGTYLAGMIFSLIAAFIFFESIYWFVPNKKMSFRVTWCGALVAASTLELFIILFPLYVRRFMGNYAGKSTICDSLWKNISLFLLGQIGFAVILLLFFFYFATILILGAQINAFFFENYKPLVDGLGTYISQMHEEHGVGEARRPLCEQETDLQQHSVLPATTTMVGQVLHKKTWLNKLWPSKSASANQTERQEQNLA